MPSRSDTKVTENGWSAETGLEVGVGVGVGVSDSIVKGEFSTAELPAISVAEI